MDFDQAVIFLPNNVDTQTSWKTVDETGLAPCHKGIVKGMEYNFIRLLDFGFPLN
jgi:hypothetical protein